MKNKALLVMALAAVALAPACGKCCGCGDNNNGKKKTTTKRVASYVPSQNVKRA